ncbi:hypothetical protein R3P93_11830 [Rhodococcus cerastii]|uniref:Uncharacterized protein n=1 Tax=Rhodococcus cerastii TaxID=908616 RepID=A0ABU4D0J4_9NOCA|nr:MULTISPECIES: hypothetical protein [Rhodococcus]MDV6303249.1 hypothetical protein [Rhodococcus cerastii]MDV7988234.1 hypothetical protein [Rhodococcus sp. IEGM 1374]MDV8055499.1 hypothetical protein [Rhodococcus sp. IEGM 1343]
MTHTLRWKDTHVSDDAQSEPTVDDATLEEAKKSVEGLDDRYRPGARPTVALPGTNGTVAGTAFADMVDDNGEMVDADDRESTDSDGSADTDHADTQEKVTSSNDA